MKIARMFFPLLLLSASSAFGCDYEVSIGDDLDGFQPSQLTISAGDSVCFYAYIDAIDTGPHNVVADDGSFRCARGCYDEGGDGAPSGGMSFTRTFNIPGVFTYHDELSHASGAIVVRTAALVYMAVEYIYGQPGGHGYVSSYFVTSSPNEIRSLDEGAFGGMWHRTGETFTVWKNPPVGALETCRFFDTAFGEHFYTPYETECAGLKKQPGWQSEGIAFYLSLPDDYGNCPMDTTAVYRLYNDGKYPPPSYPDTKSGAPLHRLTTSAEVFDQMRAAGWIFEGDGRTFVFACAPSSAAAPVP